MSKHMFVDIRVAILKPIALHHCCYLCFSNYCIIADIDVFATIANIGTIDVIAAIDTIADMDDNADAKANVTANHDMPTQENICVGWMTCYT
jgi:hypothetical protein